MTRVLTEAFTRNFDPTHTTGLRNSFVKAMRKNFNELAVAVKKTVYDRDCFGLVKQPLAIHQVSLPDWQAFDFVRSADKIDAFMKWLKEQEDKGLLKVRAIKQIGRAVEEQWMNLYLFDAYKRGIIRARYELKKAGITVPGIDESGGIDMIIGLPFHIDRLGLIYTRAYNELKGVTAQMDTIISRILAQGLAEGDSPALLARKLVEAINSTGVGDLAIKGTTGRGLSALQRATILARTEIIRAHHLATIQEYRNWGVVGIVVKGEWKTAGDNRVCPKCAHLEGQIFTLDEIEGMIPAHPQCRCIALPYIEELQNIK